MDCSMHSIIELGLFISITNKDKKDTKLQQEKYAKEPISRRPMITLKVL